MATKTSFSRTIGINFLCDKEDLYLLFAYLAVYDLLFIQGRK
jgi:hypothetical protein